MKFDVKKDRKDLYQPGARDFVEVDVPPQTFLSAQGHGGPDSPDYSAAVSSLYAAAYAVKRALRNRSGDDFVVGPLEGLWVSEDPGSFAGGRREAWDWTMLIPLPEVVSEADVAAGLAKAAAGRPDLPVASVQPLRLHEGRSLQILHIGPYAAEAPTLARLHHEVMPALGVTWNGAHHEIYLGDPNRVAPEKLRTVLRQPVRALP